MTDNYRTCSKCSKKSHIKAGPTCPHCGAAIVINTTDLEVIEAEVVDQAEPHTRRKANEESLFTTCRVCGQKISKRADLCPKCGEPNFANGEKKAFAKGISIVAKKQLTGFIGAVLLFIGVFTPIVHIPIIGNMNYFQNGKGDGIFVLVLALITIIFLFLKNFKGLWFTGLGSLAILAFTFTNFQMKMSGAKAQMERELAGNPFRGLADMAMQSVQLQWGWALLIVGAVLVIVSAAIKEESL